jgi:predicted nuclease of restriction endonuclease-like (RecB) superfamily
VLLYWEVGREILQRQEREGWGAKVIDRLAGGLRAAFPDMGWSPRSLKYMRAFARAWPQTEIVQGRLAQLPWSHQIALLEKLEEMGTRLWYADRAAEHGWTRDVLVHQIEGRLHLRQGRGLTNFDRTLPSPSSDASDTWRSASTPRAAAENTSAISSRCG